MKIFKCIVVLLAALALPALLHAQSYMITSSSSAWNEVKVGRAEWRRIVRNDLNHLALSPSDSIRVTRGSISIRGPKKNKFQIAFAGTWSVAQIWDGKAVPSRPNSMGFGGVSKAAATPLFIDVASATDAIGNSFRIGDTLTSVVLANLGEEGLYTVILWIEEDLGQYTIPPRFSAEAHYLPAGQVSVFPFREPVGIAPPPGAATVCVVYANHPFDLPEYPGTLTLPVDLGRFLSSCGLNCATRLVMFVE